MYLHNAILSLMLLTMVLISQLAIGGTADLSTPKLEVKTPVNGNTWQTDDNRYDYIKPCPDVTPYVAIVVQGVNRRDVLEKNATGGLAYYGDVSIGYSKLISNCAMLIAPKSGLITTVNSNNEPRQWRTWWLTGGLPIKDEDKELEALIQVVLDIDGELDGVPIYLVIGNDYGTLTEKVMEELSVMRLSSTIDGFIHINRHDGKATKYNRT